MDKWIKMATIAGIITLGASSVALANFQDVEPNTNYEKAINSLVEDGVLNGYPDNTFRPSAKVTRAEFAKMISLLEALELKENNKKEFTDVLNHWANSYIELAASNNLLKGYEDNSFKPQKEITYGEVATILLRTLGIYEVSTPNTKWPDDCMNYAMEIGLFDGVVTNDLLGMNPARRDNVALMLWNKEKYELSQIQIPSGDKEEVKEENDKPVVNLKKTNNLGIVDKITERRGEKYITVKMQDDVLVEIKLYSKSAEPKLNSLIVFAINTDGDLKLKKELLAANIDTIAFIVEEVDENLVKLKDESTYLDLELKEYASSTGDIKLTKYNYYVVDMAESEDGLTYEFDDIESTELSKLNLKKNDRLCFDENTKVALIIKGIE